MWEERALKFVLRLASVLTLSAALFVFIPRPWMERSHEWLGLGPMAGGPLPEYLARSISAMYALIGGAVWLLSTDLRRHPKLIRYYGWAHVTFGVVLAVIDTWVGMPMYWRIQEPLAVTAFGVAILVLERRITSPPPSSDRSRSE
jgi:hypothetical protein